MANSVDPDQTAPSGFGSALFAYIILSETLVFEILGNLPYVAPHFANLQINHFKGNTKVEYSWSMQFLEGRKLLSHYW